MKKKEKISKVSGYLKKENGGKIFARCIVYYESGKRSFVGLGPYGSPESQKKYRDIVLGAPLAPPAEAVPACVVRPIEALFNAFLDRMEGRIDKSDYARISLALSLVHEAKPGFPLEAFKALAFSDCIDYFQHVGRTVEGERRKKAWSRTYINKMISDVKRVFRWGVSRELVTPEQRDLVESVPVLLKSQTDAPELPAREDVDDATVLKTFPFLPPLVRDMVRVQRGAAMRPKELYTLRVGDLEKDGPRWVACASAQSDGTKGMSNKTRRFGTSRVIAFGVAETGILKRRCKGKKEDDFVFSPKEAWIGEDGAERKTSATKDSYTADTYAGAVKRGIQRARAAGVQVEDWTPYQLRHAGLTALSKAFGHEVAQYAAGHSSPTTTEIYDHKARAVSVEVAEKREAWWE